MQAIYKVSPHKEVYKSSSSQDHGSSYLVSGVTYCWRPVVNHLQLEFPDPQEKNYYVTDRWGKNYRLQ